ncbi:MAG: hypothetical protein V4543_12015 [Bacteroidota bacterium]
MPLFLVAQAGTEYVKLSTMGSPYKFSYYELPDSLIDIFAPCQGFTQTLSNTLEVIYSPDSAPIRIDGDGDTTNPADYCVTTIRNIKTKAGHRFLGNKYPGNYIMNATQVSAGNKRYMLVAYGIIQHHTTHFQYYKPVVLTLSAEGDKVVKETELAGRIINSKSELIWLDKQMLVITCDFIDGKMYVYEPANPDNKLITDVSRLFKDNQLLDSDDGLLITKAKLLQLKNKIRKHLKQGAIAR